MSPKSKRITGRPPGRPRKNPPPAVMAEILQPEIDAVLDDPNGILQTSTPDILTTKTDNRGENYSLLPHSEKLQRLIYDKYIARLTDTQITAKYHICQSTIYNWLKTAEAMEIRFRIEPVALQKELSLDLFERARWIVAALSEEKIKQAKIYELTQLLNAVIANARLLGGQATQVQDVRHFNAPKFMAFINIE